MGSEPKHVDKVSNQAAASSLPTGDAMIRAAQNNLPVPDFESTAFVAPPPLSEAVVAIVTTAGLHHADEPGWNPDMPESFTGNTWRADQSFRVLERSRRDYVMAHWSPNIDRVGFAADHNVVFPIDRLEEMAREGVIKEVAAQHIAFVGTQSNLSTIRYDSGPAAAQLLKRIGVNLVLLTPVCPTCTRTVGTLAHVLEAEGIATVGISLVRGQTERLRPPRFLYCEFPFGRPLGKPGDPDFQRRVVDLAFTLLAQPEGPVLEDFPEVISDESNQPLACTMPPRFNPDLPPAVDEALALRSAYDRQLAAAGGRTSVGRVMSADQVSTAVTAFVKIAEGTPWDSAGLPGNPADTALDLRSYYEEAALALSDHVPAAKAAEAWLHQTTELGKVLRQARVKMEEAGLAPDLWNQIVPIGQLDPRSLKAEFERIKRYDKSALADK